MKKKNVTRDDVIKFKGLFDRGMTENEIIELKLSDFSPVTLNKIKNGYYDYLIDETVNEIVRFDDSDIKVLLEASQKYSMLLNVIFNSACLNNRNENKLHLNLIEIKSFLRNQENELYKNKIIELQKEEGLWD